MKHRFVSFDDESVSHQSPTPMLLRHGWIRIREESELGFLYFPLIKFGCGSDSWRFNSHFRKVAEGRRRRKALLNKKKRKKIFRVCFTFVEGRR